MISNIICFICGKTGSGKSYLLNYILHKEYQLNRRGGMVILDLRGDHLNLLKEPKFKYTRISGDILNNYNIDWGGILTAYPYLLIEPYKLSREEYEQLADNIAGGIVEIGNRIYVLEEAGLAFPVYSGVRRNLSVLIVSGRKLNLDCYFTSQRPSQVNTTAVAEANVRIAFSMDDKNDVQRMLSYFPNENFEELKRFDFLAKDTFTGEIVKGNTNNLQVLNKILWKNL